MNRCVTHKKEKKETEKKETKNKYPNTPNTPLCCRPEKKKLNQRQKKK
jgi:hypothetical protein